MIDFKKHLRTSKKEVLLYADGSSTGRSDKPGGWGYVILCDRSVFGAAFGGDPKTTNNRMELMAILKGLTYLKKHELFDMGRVIVVSDSQYALGVASGSMNPTVNLDIVEPLQGIFRELQCVSRWVKGHSGDTWNERVDSLAKKGKLQATELSEKI